MIPNHEKLYRGVSHAAWAYFFLYFDINLGSLNILPDFMCYVLLWSAIGCLEEEERDLALLRPLCVLLGVWAGADWVFTLLGGTLDGRFRPMDLLISVASDATDEEKEEAKNKAQEVLDKINSGELSFEDAVEQYSDDAGSKADGGDVGWDKLTSFVTEYQDALSNLEKGQVSGIVETTYGYHIIKCTDYFHVDGEVSSLDNVPQEIQDYISNVVKSQEESTAYDAWWEDYKEKADIEINPMPEDVPYNVSLDGIEPSTGSAQ